MAITDTLTAALLPLRIVQFIFAIIVLGLTVASYTYGSPSQINFLLFVSIWTFLVLIYLIVTQFTLQQLTHNYATLGLEALTMLFWFAGFIAVAVLVSGFYCDISYCKEAKAATVFGAFEWVLFAITTALAALNLGRNRGSTGTTAATKPTAGATV